MIGALADAVLAGEWSAEFVVQRVEAVLGDAPRWLPTLVRRLQAAYPNARGLTTERVAAWLRRDPPFRQRWRRELRGVVPRQRFVVHPELPAARVPLRGAIPALATLGDVADWLEMSPARLAGLVDRAGWLRRAPRSLRNYRRWWVRSRRPGGTPRLLEAPKDRLRRAQRRVLHGLLSLVPVHPAAHGFVEGRSVWTAAAVHAGESWLVRLDLRSFFVSIHRRRVAGVFATAGLPAEVAFGLAGLCTTRTPSDVLRAMPDFEEPTRGWVRAVLDDPHLPQGAPTSPALANLCAYRLDARLAGLARARGVHYTRYADDLFFSGSRGCAIDGLVHTARAIAHEEGFALHDAKQRAMGPGTAHRCLGLVVNRAPAVPRRERERLEAILTNCVRRGPASQNREGHLRWRQHLEGRVAWVSHVHPRHGGRLRAIFERIAWE